VHISVIERRAEGAGRGKADLTKIILHHHRQVKEEKVGR
jgi:hypothetical protein